MAESKKDAIEKLSKGKPTKHKIGSRAVPHRLNRYERKLFELAKDRGYLSVKGNHRKAIYNTWRDLMKELRSTFIIHIKGEEKDSLIIETFDENGKTNHKDKIEGNRSEIKKIIKRIDE